MMEMLTLVYTYYDNGGMLDRHLAEWRSYSPEVKSRARAIIVDDGSPNDPAINHIQTSNNPFPVEVYRIKENIVWNVPGARNLGMDRAPDGWCLLTDIDHLLTVRDAERLIAIRGNLARGAVYTLARKWADGRPLNSHPNSYVIERETYWKAGGTDEDWAGWWGAGEHVFRRALTSVARRHEIRNIYLTHYGRDDIPDASTREWGRRDSDYNWTKNPILVAKAQRSPYRAENPLRFQWERVL